ncbi:hypothetical protein [Nonomuraea sp. B19D2]|uniref:hypothetical protein n=1 Tax=Nonomuraea sp. B19D2 TaxID=3159561 RepID=UPI0032DBE430
MRRLRAARLPFVAAVGKESTSALWLAGATQSALKSVVDQHETINRLGAKLSGTEDLHTAIAIR